MDNGLIPKRYAKALYKFALEKGDTKSIYALVKHVIDVFRGNPGLQKVLANPFVKNEDKEALLVSAAGKDNEIFKNFIRLIIDQKRVDYAYGMMLAYRDLYRKENKISQVQITTASKLESAQMSKLKELVENSFKGMTLEFSETVNPDLIGGFVVDVDSVRLDASLSNELEQIRQSLLGS